MTFVAGETVGPYRIIEQLGSGGMATVFKAYHASLDRYVAIKVLHPAFKADPNFLARFQREARVVAKLEHANIVPVYDFSEHGGQPYLVMRYVEGETLKARLGRGPLPLADVLAIVHAVGAALRYAHAQGVLHRDIKPSNVMLTPKGDVFLTDFGLARIAQAGESTLSQDSILGTPQYISPEQAKGERDLDARTDVYSLGVVLYELLVGRVPYQADTPFAVVHDHIFTPLPMPRSINPDLPEPLERFLLKALSKNRADRFESIEHMMTALNRAVDEAGVRLPESASTVINASEATMVASAAQATVAATPGRKPISPVIWIGLGALVVIAVGVVLLLARPRQTPAATVEPRNPPQVTSPVPADKPPVDLPPDAEQAAVRALEEANAIFREASDLVLQSRPEQARGSFTRAAERAEQGLEALAGKDVPPAGDLHVVASEAWLASGHAEPAEPHFMRLIEIMPDSPKPMLGLALTYLLEDRVEEALGRAGDALAMGGDLPEAHAVRGCALLKSGDRLAAVRELRLAANATDRPVVPPWMMLVLGQLECRLEQ